MSKSILVIDQNNVMTEWLKVTLEDGAFKVMVANSALEGIMASRHYKPDIIILDLVLPGEDGLELCKNIRCFSNAPILILSALNKPSLVAKALDLNADDFLSKPVHNGVLIARLNRLTRRM